MTILINGKEIAQNLRNELKKEIDNLKSKIGKTPGLAVVQVGDVAASSVYVKAKTKSAKEVGIKVIDHHLQEKTTQEDLLKLVETLNNQDNVNGILESGKKEVHWSLIEYSLNSNAYIVMIPIQDLLGLGSNARMNTPGTISNENWSWRLPPNKLNSSIIEKMKQLTQKAKRV